MNSFFINTPFQLIVAQGIIVSENLTDSILFIGHNGYNEIEQRKGIENLLSKGIWKEIIDLGKLDDLLPSLGNISQHANTKAQLAIISKKTKDSKGVYLGDINHPFCVFLSTFLKNKKIFIFEEGLAHYNLSILDPKPFSIFNRIKHILLEVYLRLFFSVNGFAKYVYNVKPIQSFHFKIEKRYNFLKRKSQELYDVKIDFKTVFDLGIPKYIHLPSFEKEEEKIQVLYLGSTLRSYFSDWTNIDSNLMNQIKIKYPNQEVNFLIKFHPKDDFETRKKILNALSSKNLKFSVIDFPSEYPIEILFKCLQVEAIAGFGSSSQIYFKEYNSQIPNILLLDFIDDEKIKLEKRGDEIFKIKEYLTKLYHYYISFS